MNLKRWAKVKHTESGEAIIPVKIKLFYKYFVDTEDVLWTDRDDEFQFITLKKFPHYMKEIEDCTDLNKLMEIHRILQEIG
jgi:hypothetical protein